MGSCRWSSVAATEQLTRGAVRHHRPAVGVNLQEGAVTGIASVLITGRDLLLDSGAKAKEVLGLGFGRSTFRFAGPVGRFTDPSEVQGTRIATSYVGIVRQFLAERGIDATVNRLDGAVETSVQLGVADVIADVVETGSTLAKAGLETFGDAILESEAVLITRGSEARPDSTCSAAGSRA